METCATVTDRHYDYLSVKSRAEWKCGTCTWKKANGLATPVDQPCLSSTPTSNISYQRNLNTTFTSTNAKKSITPTSIPRPIAVAPKEQLDQEKLTAGKKKVVTNVNIMSELINFRDHVMKQFLAQNGKIDDVVTTLGEIKNCVREVSTKCSTLRIDVDNLCESLEGTKDNRDMLSNVVESIQLRLQQLEINNHSLQDKLSTASTKVTSLQQKVPAEVFRTDSDISTKDCIGSVLSTDKILDKTTSSSKIQQIHTQVHAPPRIPTKPLANELKVDELICEDDGWQVHTSKKSKRSQQPVIRGSCQQVDHQLQTVERTKRLHACFFKPDTAPEAVKAHMEQICGKPGYEVAMLKLKHNRYASFVLTIPESTFQIFTSPTSWPAGTEIREWFPRGAGSATYSSRPHTPGAAFSSRSADAE